MSALLEVRDLEVRFPMPRASLFAQRRHLHAVRGVSFAVPEGRALGIVGESGSGKTTAAMACIRLVRASGGEVLLDGEDLLALDEAAMRRRRRDVQPIFQDPYSSLNPRSRVSAAVREPLDLMDVGAPGERAERVREMFSLVGLRADQMSLFPHQFSGGQRQRIAIARALSASPRLLVCDEPVSALDVAIQAQILNLLADLRERLGLSYLFISHDLGVVRLVCDEVAVMYLGEIVERGPAEEVFASPAHPYTQALLEAAPSLARRRSSGRGRPRRIAGDPPSPVDLPAGCSFASRCPLATDLCRAEPPPRKSDGGRDVSCHLA